MRNRVLHLQRHPWPDMLVDAHSDRLARYPMRLVTPTARQFLKRYTHPRGAIRAEFGDPRPDTV